LGYSAKLRVFFIWMRTCFVLISYHIFAFAFKPQKALIIDVLVYSTISS